MFRTGILPSIAAILALSVSANAPSGASEEEGQDPGTHAGGQKLYATHCAICHGIGGTGGRGPRLDIANLRRGSDKESLVKLIGDGIRGTEMPGNWFMGDKEQASLAEYVRSLGRTVEVELPGDPARGHAIYEENDCSDCHIIDGRGEGYGPELSDVGLRRNADYLRQALTEPEAESPKGFLMVEAVTPTETIEGIRVNEDSFSIQLRDVDGRLHSFRKSQLENLNKRFHETPMASYEDLLTEAELDDLVAYLASLRGER